MTIKQQVLNIISHHVGVSVEDISLQDSLTEDLGATDLEVADLIAILEEQFKLTIPDEEAINLVNVGDFITYISDQLGEFE